MNPFSFGTLLLYAGVSLGIMTAGAGILGYFRQQERLVFFARRGLFATTIAILLASLLLILALLLDRFELKYIAYNSSRATPILYKLSAFWGSLDGSLLLWALFLGIFSSLFLIRMDCKDLPPLGIALSIPAIVLAFFLATALATANPFSPLVDEQGTPFVPKDGLGLNPLLQHPAMVLHPPFLYLGFTGFTIPFSLAFATLVHDPLDSRWLTMVRKSTLFAFGFLSLGILMGSNWAYMELGWGGYWGWDPVENSSLLPWLSGTAFLHSLIVQEYRGLLRGWNFFLIFLTFWLTLFGTFITRSGVVSSVHAFAEGAVGIWFLSFLGIVVLTSVGVLLYRLPLLRSSHSPTPPLSREGMFLLNNLLFIALAFSILWGTTYPLLYEIFSGSKITIGTPYYTRVTYPLGVMLLLLLGIGPLIPWGGQRSKNLIRRIRIPLFLSGFGTTLLVFAGVHKPQALVFYSFLIFSVTATGITIIQGLRTILRHEHMGVLRGIKELFFRNSRRYGGYLVHLGIAFIFLGISGEFYHQEQEFWLEPAKTLHLAGHKFTLQGIESREGENYLTRIAFVRVITDEGKELLMWPEKRIYLDGRKEKTTEVAIASSPFEDRYLIFLEDLPGGSGSFRFHITPLVFWIWIGGIVVVLGVIVTLLGRVPTFASEEETRG